MYHTDPCTASASDERWVDKYRLANDVEDRFEITGGHVYGMDHPLSFLKRTHVAVETDVATRVMT